MNTYQKKISKITKFMMKYDPVLLSTFYFTRKFVRYTLKH